MRLADSRKHGADLGDQGVGVRSERQRVLEFVAEVGHAARHRAAARREAQGPAQYRAVVGCAVCAAILGRRYF